MSSAFGGFLHTSPLSNLSSSTAIPPNPSLALASNCIRDYFGPIVQTVADCLQSRGPATLSELVSRIRAACMRDGSSERGRLVQRLNVHGTKVRMNQARGSEAAGFITEPAHIRAALLVLLQHSLVSVSGGMREHTNDAQGLSSGKPDPTLAHTHYTYAFLAERARLLPRYPTYVAHAHQTVDEHAASIVQHILLSGRMRAEDVIQNVWDTVQSKEHLENDNEDIGPLKAVVGSFRKLVEGGYAELVKPLITAQDLNAQQEQQKEIENGIHGGEVEFDMNEDGTIVAGTKKRLKSSNEEDHGSNKKPKPALHHSTNMETNSANKDGTYGSMDGQQQDNPQIVSLLSPLRKLIPPGSIYRINTSMFHASFRATVIGRLVSELYGPAPNKKGSQDNQTLNFIGPIVTAALIFTARQEHAPLDRIIGLEESEEEKHHRMAEWGIFSPSDILPYVPSEVTKSLQSQVGGTVQNLSAILLHMSKLKYPRIIIEVESAGGHPLGGKFEICTRQLLQQLRDRILHCILTSHQGLKSARIVSILRIKGHMESDAIAEDAMVPAKEARELLHRLHRNNYINLFDMHLTKSHNSATAIYLWNVIPSRLLQTVIQNVQLAMLNLRLRRQHEVEVGKEWIDRAKEAGTTEENTDQDDKKKYHKFCIGLERLDCACLQLDETLMVLKDM